MFLSNLSYLRFWFHALFTPLLIIFVWQISVKLHLKWSNTETSKVIIFLLTIGLIIYEWYQSLTELQLKAKWENDVLMYESVSEQGFPVMVLITTLVVGWVGILLWKNQQFKWLSLGTAIMIIGSILAIWVTNGAIMNIFELVFIASLLMTKKFQIKKTASPFS